MILHAQSPRVLELQKNWKLISASRLADSGAIISRATYDATKWYPIRRMPATILDILQEDGVYPTLYYGMNLLTEVPQNLWKQDWWYRGTFQAPVGRNAFWIDFPGINYRAEIWLNGKLVANDRQAVGMYNDHQFNVTQMVYEGGTNVIAVKVTPERLIRDVNGVELADSWHDIINWSFLGYKGPLNVHDVPTSYLSAIYIGQGKDEPSSSAAAKVTVKAATTSSLTLMATVTSVGRPVTSGTIVFMDHGTPIGRREVNSDGTATLTVDRPEAISFLPDRNAGIWKPVSVYIAAPVRVLNAVVDTDLPLPAVNPAKLTIYANVTNGSSVAVHGTLEAKVTRAGKPTILVAQSVSLAAGATLEVTFAPSSFTQLTVNNPDLWWPYTMGLPALYNLHLQFVDDNNQISDVEDIRFGIRKITQARDDDNQFPETGKGGNFYLKVNGKDFLIRGAYYTPDLLYRYDPKREATAISYVKDMGLNMLRWESKISSEHIIDLADEAGVPVMLGWMCCNEWERWNEWSAEDYRVAHESLRSQILMLRSHAAVFLWANASDGLPPKPVLADYHHVLTSLHWQNAVVDTVSSYSKDANGNRLWDGIHMQGPYSWRPPSYWFSGRYAAARGSCAEQGDNENVPPYESLRKFVPRDKLWPIGKYWYFHAGGNEANSALLNTQRALSHRYGPSSNAEEFAKKAQLGLYEDTRAQFEDFAANGWANHKMTIYFMMDTPWPSFFAHLYDYYEKPGGAYYGAKKGLRPLSVVFDYYATGDHTDAKIRVVNQTAADQGDLRVRTRVYDLLGNVRYDKEVDHIKVPSQGVAVAVTMPVIYDITSTYFVRCELFDKFGAKLVDNVYWQSTSLDDFGGLANDDNPFATHEVEWANFTALNAMPKVQLEINGTMRRSATDDTVEISLRNPSKHIAFFERAEVTKQKGGDEILPITYDDNYVTVFPGETVHISSTFGSAITNNSRPWLKLEGYNTSTEVAPIEYEIEHTGR